MNKNGTIKSVLIVVILLLVVVLGVLGLNTAKTYIGGASADTKPKNVLAKPNDDGKSATISWMSDKATVGVVEYGTSPAALLLRAPESDSTTTHTLVLSPLKPAINYYFRIRVGEEIFDNNGIPFSFKTKSAETVTKAPVGIEPVGTGLTMASVLPTSAAVSECKKTEDYNKDGTINTMDYIDCLRKRPVGGVGTPCGTSIDYNKDGVINSLDRIKCLQNK